MGLTDHRVSAHVSPQLHRDLAGAQALGPELGEQFNLFLGPGHARTRPCRPDGKTIPRTGKHGRARVATLGADVKGAPRRIVFAALTYRTGKLLRKGRWRTLSVTRDMSGFGSTRSVRFLPEGSHAAGGQNGPDHRCDWVASSEEVELRRGGGAVGDERAALSPAARRL